MSKIEKSMLNQMRVYCAALKALIYLKICDKYSKQVDITINNMYITSHMILLEAKRECDEVKCQ